ncbi:hypothetical protein SAMN04487961_3062 [Marinobacter pelagius]|uniref:Uncharacterized protein n=2 Tax=Marinobacter pelagius TaxID=379482 RepID=A0A1I4YYB9_9GAMM|nr:hypothetical protein SAMN04487961_3062 [Marinobacter pelagius]
MRNIRPTLKQRLNWALTFTLANGLIATVIGLNYLRWMSVSDGYTTAYVFTLYGGQFFLLAMVFGLPLILLAFAPWRTLLITLGSFWAAILICLLSLDTAVYAQYRFHLSGFVLELAAQAGQEVFNFSGRTWLEAGFVATGVLIGEIVLAWVIWHWHPRFLWLGAAFATTLAFQMTAHGWHAWADAHYDTRITTITRHVPLYYGATAKRFFKENGLIDPEKIREQAQLQEMVGARSRAEKPDYPKHPLACLTPESPPNILIIAVDSLRWDMLDEQWMPAVSRLAKSSLVFHNHRSNGNATKPGIFTLFYGLPASYWDLFSSTHTPPLLIQRIQELGYVLRILSSTTLVSPAFDRNVFSSVENLRLQTPGSSAWERDAQITDDWLASMEEWQQEQRNQPFFGFLFYDSPHSFSPPPDFPRVEPFWDPVNVLELDNDFDPEPYFNVYKTTVRYTDHLIDQVLEDLRQRSLLDNTIVLITADHGKEFNENGKNYWGHGSNFSDYQLRVPLIIHWPGREPAEIYRDTVHFDIAPTLLRSVLGCSETPAENLASDFGLFAENSRHWTIAHSYMSHALLIDDTIVVTDPAGNVDILDKNLEPKASFPASAVLVQSVLQELARFNKN